MGFVLCRRYPAGAVGPRGKWTSEEGRGEECLTAGIKNRFAKVKLFSSSDDDEFERATPRRDGGALRRLREAVA